MTLLERTEGARAVGAGIALAENGLAVLEALGFGADLARIGSPIEGVRVTDAAQRTLLFDMDMAILDLRRGGGDTPEVVRLTGCYHNLLRMWGES